MNKYDRVMPRVYNRSRSSLKSTSFVTRHQTPTSSVLGAKPSVSNVSSGVSSDLPVVLNDYKLEPEKLARRPYVVKPRKTLKSLDPALSPPRSVRRSQEFRPKFQLMKSRGSAPCVLGPTDEKWPETHMRQCLSSRSHIKLKELKDEIKAYEEKGKMSRLRSELFQRCGVLLDEMGHPAEDKAVQVEVDTDKTQNTERSFNNPFDSESELQNKKETSTKKKTGTKPSAPKKPKSKKSQDLFGSESDSEPEPVRTSTASKSKKRKLNVFPDSEDEGEDPIKAEKLKSYVSRKVGSGYTVQSDPTKRGEYYIEVRVSNADELQAQPSSTRWKHSLISFKTAVDEKSATWRAVSRLVTAVKEDYRGIRPILYGQNNF